MMRLQSHLTVALLAGSLAVSQPLGAQMRVDRPAGIKRHLPDSAKDSLSTRLATPTRSDARRRIPGVPGFRRYAPIASAIIPGSGQFVIGEDRFIAYAAIEAAMWLKRHNDRADQIRQEREFRGLARDVARVHYSSNPPDADWEYYEDMRKFLESGEYSLADDRLVPETNPATFNGFIWQSAVEHNPDTASALTEYQRRAVKPDFRWSWRNAQLEWDIYKRKTGQRNDAAGRVASDLVVIGANHVLSMVDAFRSVRLRAYIPPGGGLGLSGSARRGLVPAPAQK